MAFRPIRLEAYDDCIEFMTEKGSFVVPIRAATPTISSNVPTNLDFGFCPVNETGTKTFIISNDGEVPITFQWSCQLPFTLAPMTGSIPPGGSCNVTAKFSPTDASVYVAECVCVVPGHRTHTMKVGGIGKYPFLSASTERLQFGGVLSGQRTTSHFKLCNSSLVYGRFNIERSVSDVEPVFTFSPSSGIVPPDGEQTIHVMYTPKVTGTFTNDRYEVRTPGGNTITVVCEGEALGPEMQLSKDVINFGDVAITIPKKHVSRVLELLNHSDTPAPYCLYGCETNGMFSIDKPSGVVPPRLSSYITLRFCPEEAGNYFKRICILLRNQSPKVVDIIGTGYTEKRRPVRSGRAWSSKV